MKLFDIYESVFQRTDSNESSWFTRILDGIKSYKILINSLKWIKMDGKDNRRMDDLNEPTIPDNNI